MKTLKNAIIKYFCNLLTFAIGLFTPGIDEMNTERYFHLSYKEIRHELYTQIVAVLIDLGIAYIGTVYPMIAFFIAIPLAVFMLVSVLYLTCTLINIAQRIWMDLHPTMSEYVDPDTGVVRTLMTYEKKRFI